MAVEEDYGPKLDDEGRRLLGVVRRNTRKMGNLIDDLLAFSRAGRHEIAARLVDMELLAEGVFAELATERDRERVRFVRRPMPRAWGDQALLRQVWVNLIGNALKFSAPREAPLIEVGAVDGPEGPEYTVRDNGVGFDPAYADKLFGVFQRLHAERDFPGTGVGLALVQRIIQRHGGSVWAEGEVGKGAAFHFRLPARGGGRGSLGARKRSEHA